MDADCQDKDTPVDQPPSTETPTVPTTDSPAEQVPLVEDASASLSGHQESISAMESQDTSTNEQGVDAQNEGEAVKSKDTQGASKSVSCKFDESWSTLTRDEVIDRVKGVIYGQAIGDAFGLATEFMTHKMAKGIYGKKGPSGYSVIHQDFHRSRWDEGDWTDDTDQMLLILQMIVDRNGTVDKLDFARRIENWKKHGFSELGDIGGMGIGMTVSRTLTHPIFLTDPQGAARDVWEKSGRYLAANGAIMRTAILGVLNFNDIEKVVMNTVEICSVTHADPRCAASCIATNTAIALMLQGKYNPLKKDQLSSLVNATIDEANKVLEHADQRSEMKEHMKASSLEKLQLDDKQSLGYTFKALGAGFYGLRNAKDFRDMILKVIMQAGDADSNGSVCGALMGCKLGFKALPQDLLAFKHREWLDQHVDRFLITVGLVETKEKESKD